MLPIAPTGIPSLPTTSADTPRPPARWARWWTSPIARVDYGAGSRMQLWAEALIPAERGLTGGRTPNLTWGGATRDAAVAVAKALAARPVTVGFSYANGVLGSVDVHPAFAVLRDAEAGAFWIAPLQTTVRRRGEWIDAPHTIDGGAFEGARPLLRTPTVQSATRDMVAVVGRDAVIRPTRWKNAPDDSVIDR